MSSNVVFYAMYNDDEVLKDGAKKLVSNGVKNIWKVFSIGHLLKTNGG